MWAAVAMGNERTGLEYLAADGDCGDVGGFETRPYRCGRLWQWEMNERDWNIWPHMAIVAT